MALQTFTAGQVLTAAQVTALQTNDFNQTVSTKTASYTLVALDKGTRVVMNSASATTITVNTSLFNAGDTLQIHNVGAGVCTITAGTATVSTAGSLALAINAGGTLYFTSTGVAIFFPSAASSASGLTLINTTSFSGVASVSLPTNTFTSAYTNYRIMFQNISPANSLAISMRLRTSGTDNSTSNYDSEFLYAQSTSPFGTGADNASSFSLTASSGARIISTIDLMNPQTADDTLMVHSTYQTTSDAGTFNVGGGRFQLGTSFDSCTFIANSVNLLTGQVQVYGYSK